MKILGGPIEGKAEKGMFQFVAHTWDEYSIKILCLGKFYYLFIVASEVFRYSNDKSFRKPSTMAWPSKVNKATC